MEQDKKPPHLELTGSILNCCFEVMKKLGPGFLENLYKNAPMRQNGLQVQVERPFEVQFRGNVIGRYRADLVVEQTVIIELKCCESLGREQQAQLFNYLKVSQLPIGLLVNFRRGKLEWKRLQSNQEFIVDMETVEEAVPF